MKCKLPNQETGSSKFLFGPMAEHYDPPGKEVREENGVKYIEVVEEVGQKLIEDHGFEAMEEQTEEQDYEVKDDDSN